MKKTGNIGGLDWADCYNCKHGNEEDGGCRIENETTFEIDVEDEVVTCDKYEEVKS